MTYPFALSPLGFFTGILWQGIFFPLWVIGCLLPPFPFFQFGFWEGLSFKGGWKWLYCWLYFLYYPMFFVWWLIRIIYVFCYLILGLSTWTMDFVQVVDTLPTKETDLHLLSLVNLWITCSLINLNISLWNLSIFWYHLKKDTWI